MCEQFLDSYFLRLRGYCCTIYIGMYLFKKVIFFSFFEARENWLPWNVANVQCAVFGIAFVDGLGENNLWAPRFKQSRVVGLSTRGTNKLIYTEGSNRFSQWDTMRVLYRGNWSCRQCTVHGIASWMDKEKTTLLGCLPATVVQLWQVIFRKHYIETMLLSSSLIGLFWLHFYSRTIALIQLLFPILAVC